MQPQKKLVHIICGALTLAMIISTYLFYDETAGQMRNIGKGLDHTLIAASQIDDTFRLMAEIQLSDFNDRIGGISETIFVINNSSIAPKDIIISVEAVAEPIIVDIHSDTYLDSSGEFNSFESFTIMLDKPENIYELFKVQGGLNYNVNLIYNLSPDEIDQPIQLDGVIKIYERFGGETNE